jgi:NCS1 family nucleobase:cation symporter-1
MSLSNEDLAPIGPAGRTWNTWNYAALWIGMSVCIPTYMLASGLIDQGMSWWQAILTVALGNLIVLVPMVLNGHAGARYGIPFPVFARASFGTLGANVPAMLRAVVACGWFGIQTWIGGAALFETLKAFVPSFADSPFLADSGVLHVERAKMVCFLAFWVVNMVIVYLGIDSIRKLLVIKSFFLPTATLALLLWAVKAAGGFGPILDQPSRFATTSDFLKTFFPALTGMVGFWATLSLNIPDFTRYAKSQRAQITGQAIGLPTSMTAVAFVGVAVTSTTILLFHHPIWDPVALVGKFEDRLIVAISMFCVVLSTLATNIAANIVSPANDFSNLWPSVIGFRAGGYITGVIGVLMCPWKLVEDPTGYIFTWLIGYSALLGPIGGILIVDYFLLRKKRLDVQDLYRHDGRYGYAGGFNPIALVALVLGILPCVPGFLATIGKLGTNHTITVTAGVTKVVEYWINLPADGFVARMLVPLYSYAWFVGFGISGVAYFALMSAVGGELDLPSETQATGLAAVEDAPLETQDEEPPAPKAPAGS